MEERSCATCRWRYAPSNQPPCSKCDGYELDKWDAHEWGGPDDPETYVDQVLAEAEARDRTPGEIRGDALKKVFEKRKEGAVEQVFRDLEVDMKEVPFEEAMKKVEEAVDTERPQGIQDSGERRVFESGAVRDMAEGKGRCDLLPLAVVRIIPEKWIDYIGWNEKNGVRPLPVLLEWLNCCKGFSADRWIRPVFIDRLENAMLYFATLEWEDAESAILDLARHFERGALKYEERNWERGIPAHSYLDSAIRHLLRRAHGDLDEDHRAAFLWNVVCLIWTLRAKPEFDDITAG